MPHMWYRRNTFHNAILVPFWISLWAFQFRFEQLETFALCAINYSRCSPLQAARYVNLDAMERCSSSVTQNIRAFASFSPNFSDFVFAFATVAACRSHAERLIIDYCSVIFTGHRVYKRRKTRNVQTYPFLVRGRSAMHPMQKLQTEWSSTC
jgi:hypothetical protein